MTGVTTCESPAWGGQEDLIEVTWSERGTGSLSLLDVGFSLPAWSEDFLYRSGGQTVFVLYFLF